DSIDKSIDFLRAHLSAAFPYLKECLEGKGEGHVFGVIAVNALLSSNALGKEEKRALLPGLIGCLPDHDGEIGGPEPPGPPGEIANRRMYWPLLVKTLTA